MPPSPRDPAAGKVMLLEPVSERDPARGPADAPVTIVEYADFECPDCREAYPVTKSLLGRFGARLRCVYRQFPLTNIHPHAQKASEAAIWAGMQGRFWEMHDALYELGRVSAEAMLDAARKLGMDPAALEQAWTSHSLTPRVKDEFLGGIRSGVTGTPTFFVNGEKHHGPHDEASLARAIEGH